MINEKQDTETKGEALVSLTVETAPSGERLDAFLASRHEIQISRSRVQSLIKQHRVRLNHLSVSKPSTKVKTGDVVEIRIPPRQKADIEAEDIPLDIIYENDDILIINKARGMVVHPGAGRSRGTLANALLSLYPEIGRVGEKSRPGIVHRLDKDTTGALVVAKTQSALGSLQSQLKARKATREYLALCKGRFGGEEGTVNAPIGRHPVDRKRMTVLQKEPGTSLKAGVREAVTHWKVITRFGFAYTLVLASLFTGRTHQIRVHLSYIGHPIAFDRVYGRARQHPKFSGPALHSFRLGLFLGEQFDEYHEFTAPLPTDFSQLLMSLKNKYKEELPTWLTVAMQTPQQKE